MSGKFMDINGSIIASTVYVNNTLAARDVALTFPEVTALTADVQAGGTLSIPTWPLTDNMELAITKIGLDMGLRAMITPKAQNYEARFVQTVTDANGNTKNVGCKAFFKGFSNKVPGIAVAIGEASENEATITVTRYQLFVDGVELFLIDKLAGICRFNGKDYGNISNLL